MADVANPIALDNVRQANAGGGSMARRALQELGRNIVGRGSSASHRGEKAPAGSEKVARGSNMPPLQRATSAGQQAMKKAVFSRCESMPMRRDQQQSQQQQQSQGPPLDDGVYQRRPLPEIDAPDADNPQAAAEYASDIYRNYHRVEKLYKAPSTYMENQNEVTPWMRGILVDWLVEVHLKFKLMPETLYITINIIDRYLALKVVRRKELQLIGVAAMFLASKYEEIWAPEVRDFVYICDKAYTRRQIIDTEKNIVIALKFKITFPTAYQFYHRYMKAAGASDRKFGNLCQFLAELALPEYDMLLHSSSLVAAASVLLALQMTGSGRDIAWPAACEKQSGYSNAQLRPIVKQLQALVVKAAQPDAELKAVYKKFSSPKFDEVAKLWEIRPDLFPVPR